jgi:hypothetical protein
LYDVRSNLQEQLAQTFGPDVAAAIAGAFVATVARRRREIEAAGATARVLN